MMKLLYRIKEFLNHRRFHCQVVAYQVERLLPELSIEDLGNPIKDKRNRRVYFTRSRYGNVIVKIYQQNRMNHALNYSLAYQAFKQTGVRIPRLLFQDLSIESSQKYGFSCMVQEYVQGEHFDFARHLSSLPKLAQILSSLHGHTSPQFGFLAQPATGFFWQNFLFDILKRKIKIVSALPFPEPERRKVINYFRAWSNRLGQGIEGWSLLHWDLTNKNCLIDDEGQPVLIDFDNSTRALYGLELIRIPFWFLLPKKEILDLSSPEAFWDNCGTLLEPFLELYFKGLPLAFRRDWEINRDCYLVWGMLIHTASLTKSIINPRSIQMAKTDGYDSNRREVFKGRLNQTQYDKVDLQEVKARAVKQWQNLIRVIDG